MVLPGERQGIRLDLDVGKPGAPLKLKTEFVGVDTDLFIKAGTDAVADLCCVFVSVFALAVDVDSSKTQEIKGSSREFEFRKLGEVSSAGGMVDLSRDSDPDFTALYDLLGLEAPVTKFDAITGFDAVSDVAAFSASDGFTNADVLTGFDAATGFDSANSQCKEEQSSSASPLQELKDIVDGMITPTPSVSLGRFPTSRLMRQEEPKLTEDIDIGIVSLDTVDAVRDNSFTRVGRKGDETEAIPGILGTGN